MLLYMVCQSMREPENTKAAVISDGGFSRKPLIGLRENGRSDRIRTCDP